MRNRWQWRRRVVLAGLTMAAAVTAVVVQHRPATADPGAVTTRQGQTYNGDVTEPDDGFIYVKTTGGQLRLDRRDVAKVDYAADVLTQFDKRHAKLAGDDVKGRIELAHWANEHNRPDLAVAILEEARQIDPVNRNVAITLADVQSQIDLDRRGAKAGVGRRPTTAPTVVRRHRPATSPVAPVATTAPATRPAGGLPRLLTADEVNAIRQAELLAEPRPGDPRVRVRLEHNVARRYTDASGYNPAEFARLGGAGQAVEILDHGTRDMARDVRILTDPTPLYDFRVRVMPVIAQACGSPACHGGTRAGGLALYPGSGAEALYTNFYILQTYAAHIDGVRYLPIDRAVPERSLVLQFGLPPLAGRPPHPPVHDWRPRFRNAADPAYQLIDDWVTNELAALQPRYGFDVSAESKPPPTRPAGPPPSPTSAP